jgi:hypothetical protein
VQPDLGLDAGGGHRDGDLGVGRQRLGGLGALVPQRGGGSQGGRVVGVELG